MSEWVSVTLGESCDILDNQRVPINSIGRAEIEGEIPYCGANGVQGYVNDFIFNEPLILIAEDGGYFDEYQTRPIAYRIHGKSWVNNHAHVLRAKPKYHQDFIFYSLQHKNITPFIKGGTRAKLNQAELKQVEFLCPEFHKEQAAIANVLETVHVSIEKTEALIAKYQQIKAGLMHDLFTRGVTADGKLRPPREQAPELYQETPLGWIPKEWEFSSVESLLERIIDYRGKTPTKTEDGIPLITAKNVRMGYIDPEPREFIAARDYSIWMTRGIPVHSDVVFTTEAPLGNVAQIGTSERVAFAQRVIILQPRLSVMPNFLRLLLMTESFQRSALRLSSGSTALGIKQSEFRKIMVGHPVRLDEQQFVSDKLIALENFESVEADKVEKLREQKLGLMSDLLTGKVRVAN